MAITPRVPDMNAETAILECLQRQRRLADVVTAVRGKGVSEAAVKAAIWQLYSLGRVEVTRDWQLRATGHQTARRPRRRR